MVRYFYKNLKTPAFKEIDKYKTGSWVYVENPSEEEIQAIAQDFKLDPGMLEDAVDEDEVPRFEAEDGDNYIFTRFVHVDEHGSIVTVPLLVIVAKGMVMTVSKKQLPRLQRFIDGKIEANTTQKIKLTLQILDQVVDGYEVRLNDVSKQIKTTRARLRVEDISNKDFISFVAIEDQLEDFLSALVPTNSILRRILAGKYMNLYEDDKDLIEDLLLNNEQSIEGCKANLKTIVNIREAYSTIMTNNLNRVIRQLTVLTAILTVPTIISGIYGMNVALPAQEYEFAFWLVLAEIVIVSAILLVVFKRQKWF